MLAILARFTRYTFLILSSRCYHRYQAQCIKPTCFRIRKYRCMYECTSVCIDLVRILEPIYECICVGEPTERSWPDSTYFLVRYQRITLHLFSEYSEFGATRKVKLPVLKIQKGIRDSYALFFYSSQKEIISGRQFFSAYFQAECCYVSLTSSSCITLLLQLLGNAFLTIVTNISCGARLLLWYYWFM